MTPSMMDFTDLLETALGHQRTGRLDAAQAIYGKILEARPDHAAALHLLGMIDHARGDHGRAIERIAEAILIAPETPEFHANIGAVYLALGQPAAARGHCRRALAIDPALAEAEYNLGNALFELGQADAAVAALERALTLDPGNRNARSNLLFAVNFSAAAGRQAVFDANRQWGADIEASAPPPPVFTNSLDPARRLRVAYFLFEPATHVTPRFLEPLLAGHHRGGFEIYVYADTAGGELPADFKGLADRWRDIGGKTPPEMAAAIRADEVDILVHACTFKARYREVLAHRAAPVQVAAVNHVSTTGLEAVDYLLTDAIIDPPGETEGYYTERLIRLANFNCYGPPRDSPDVAPPPAADNGFVTFGSFNNPAKLSPAALGAWAKILARVTGARLVLKHRGFDEEAARDDFTERFAGLGGDIQRLDFKGFTMGRAGYLGQYAEIDIGLDPFPFGGGTTTYEALWMGVPVVTLMGDSFMGRLGASLVTRCLGVDFVAADAPAYVEAAVTAAAMPDALTEIRAGLRAKAQNELFDAPQHILELEGVYREMWGEYGGKLADSKT